MDVFSLRASITLDSSGYDKAMNSAQKSGASLGTSLKSMSGTVKNIGGDFDSAGKAANDYDARLKTVSEAVKVLDSEMNLVNATFSDQEGSIENLRAENDVLERSILTLNEQLQLQEQALLESAQAYGEADTQTLKWQQSVNNTKTAIADATNQFNANKTAISQLSGETSLTSTVFSRLRDTLTGKVGNAFGMTKTQVTDLTKSLFSGGEGAGALASAAGALAPVLGVTLVTAAAKAAKAIAEMTEEAGKNADAIHTMSTNYGIATSDLQKFQYMSELVDVSVDTITGSISKLTRSMNDARDGTGDAAEAFAQLGISVIDAGGNLRGSNAVFMETIDALGQIENATERDALTMQIFGRSAMELNSLIAQGSEGLRAYAEEAERSGYVMSENMLDALQKEDDAVQRLNKAQEAFNNTIGAAAAPIKTFFTEFATGAVTLGTNVLLEIGHATEGIKLLGEMAVDKAKDLLNIKDAADETTSSVNALTNAITTLNGVQISASSIRDVTAEDFLTPEQRSYKKYVEDALKFQQETGQKVTIYRQDVLSDRQGYYSGQYNSANQQPINVTLQLDGQTLARTTYSYNQAEATRRGPSLIG